MGIKDMKKRTKMIILVEAILVFGILGYLFFSTAPSQLYPLSGMIVIDNDFKFEIENSEKVMISSDKEFIDPIILSENDDVTLPPGVYYWKVKGLLRESDIMNFTIQGHVALTIKGNNNTYELKNSGNVDLNVTDEELVKSILLEIGESEGIKNDNSTYEGEQI